MSITFLKAIFDDNKDVEHPTKDRLQVLLLVKDMDRWNKYPWGSVLYKDTVQSLHAAFIRSNMNELWNASARFKAHTLILLKSFIYS